MKKAISYIRFSTPEQAKGDSYRRQYDATLAYCQKQGLELDSSFYDQGVSAFTGQQRNKGELGELIHLIEHGYISKGSVLVVESLDRLSRENVAAAMSQFLGILEKGVSIVTLVDGVEHSATSIEKAPYSLMMALLVMVRANEESATKSKRLAAAWKAKRQRILEKPLTSILPQWLILQDDKIIVIHDRAKVVRDIYKMSLDGMGRRSIANELNKRKEPIWGGKRSKSGIWRDSYVSKILRNKAVIGEYQPHTKKDGKRIPIGEPITDYFPIIIDQDTFYAVQNATSKRIGKGGRSVDKARNLFSGICFCGNCGAKMDYLNKGNGWEYLSCQRRKIGCNMPNLRYSDLETFVINHLLNDKWDDGKQAQIIDLSAIEAQQTDINKQIGNVLDAIATLGLSPNLSAKLSSLEATASILDKNMEREKATTAAAKLTIDDVAFLKRIHKKRDRLDYRRKVKKYVLQVISEIRISHDGQYFITMNNGRYCIGKGNDWMIYQKWQICSDYMRKAIAWRLQKIKDVGYAYEPSLVTHKKGVDLLSPFNVIIDEFPKKAQNAAVKKLYEQVRDDFDSLQPRVSFNDGQKATWGKHEGFRSGLKEAQERAKAVLPD